MEDVLSRIEVLEPIGDIIIEQIQAAFQDGISEEDKPREEGRGFDQHDVVDEIAPDDGRDENCADSHPSRLFEGLGGG